MHNENGNASAAVHGLTATVIAASNATPIVIQTAANHGYSTSDRVAVYGVLGNLAANANASAPWVITVTGADTFQLNGSVGSGAYTAGGTCFDLSLTPPMALPDDGVDPRSAATVDDPLTILASKVQKIAELMGLKMTMQSITWNANTTWVAPKKAGVLFGLLIGYGGGGGGGSGVLSSVAVNQYPGGGGGGGGTMSSTQLVAIIPGTSYDAQPGAGGAANADGTDSIFKITAGATLNTFRGGGKGQLASVNLLTPRFRVYHGGNPSKTSSLLLTTAFADFPMTTIAPGQGGVGTDALVGFSQPGGGSLQGFDGGANALSGADAGTRRGGGGGGGGGAGPNGAGGAGGVGGIADAGVGGTAGAAGVAGAAQSGAGGGGGGGGGCNNAVGNAGGAGGAGGSGRITLVLVSLE